MKAFTNANPRDVTHALTLVGDARQNGRTAALAGGGSDLLGMMKDRLVAPDLVVNLKSVRGLDQVTRQGRGVDIGGLITLDALARHPIIRKDYPVTTRFSPKRQEASRRRKSVMSRRLPETSASGRGAGISATASSA
jgi:CO/xanthine dehydrogenase FAD-binding subunit